MSASLEPVPCVSGKPIVFNSTNNCHTLRESVLPRSLMARVAWPTVRVFNAANFSSNFRRRPKVAGNLPNRLLL